MSHNPQLHGLFVFLATLYLLLPSEPPVKARSCCRGYIHDLHNITTSMPGPGYGELIDLAELPGSPVMHFPFNNTPRNERRISPTPAKAAERFIAIGIDFGTT